MAYSPNPHQSYLLLQESVSRVLAAYDVIDAVVERSEVLFAVDGSDDPALRELFALLKPDEALTSLVTKQWQDVSSL